MEEGVEGLLRDKTRPSRVQPLGPDVAEGIPLHVSNWQGAFLLCPLSLLDGEQIVGGEGHAPLTLAHNLDEAGLGTRRYGTGKGYAVTHGSS